MKKIVTYSLMLFITGITLVQPVWADDCGDLPPCHYADDVPGITCCELVEAPFDGGVSLMMAAGGIGMAIRAVRKRKQVIGKVVINKL